MRLIDEEGKTPNQAAKAVGLSPSNVYAAVRERKLPKAERPTPADVWVDSLPAEVSITLNQAAARAGLPLVNYLTDKLVELSRPAEPAPISQAVIDLVVLTAKLQGKTADKLVLDMLEAQRTTPAPTTQPASSTPQPASPKGTGNWADQIQTWY